MEFTTTADLMVNGDRLNQSIASLASIGQLPNGGVKRIAYSPEDIEARNLVRQWMIELEMEVAIDAAGNIIGKYPGKSLNQSAVATGSHIDTVPCGGHYDGAYGVLAGLEVIRVLKENQIKLDRPIEVIVFTDEEGSTIGSKAMSGRVIKDPEYYRRPDGTDIQTCLKRVGGNWDKIVRACRRHEDISAFVELQKYYLKSE